MKYRFNRAAGASRHGGDVMCGLCTAFSSVLVWYSVVGKI